jgi:hypothetical protein
MPSPDVYFFNPESKWLRVSRTDHDRRLLTLAGYQEITREEFQRLINLPQDERSIAPK